MSLRTLLVSAGLLVVMITPSPHASDYGTTGLIDVPTARFESDGTFIAAASIDDRHKQYSLTYQVTPWLQGTFRYTGFGGTWDRNYEFKARVLEEGRYVPELAIGIRDMLGTGLFESEYIVGSKRLGKTDVTLGMAWGRLAGDGDVRNPLVAVDSRFETRSPASGAGGEFSLGNYFSGADVGFFGGVSHGFEAVPLTVMLEYNPDNYEYIVDQGGGDRPSTPWSAGVTWHASPGIDIRFSLQHGDEIGIGFRSSLDSTALPAPPSRASFVSSYYLTQSQLPPQINKSRWYDRLLYDAERSGLILVEGGVSGDGHMAQIVVGNADYAIWSDAIGKHLALADLHLPATVKSIHFVIEEAGHRTATLVIPRPSASFSSDVDSILRQSRVLPGRLIESPQHKTGFATGKVNHAINLRTRFQLFDPDDPARYQVFAELSSDYTINSHWSIRSSFALDIDNNFDESNRLESGSALQKVRSDVVRYLIQGDSGLEKLIVEGRHTLGRSLHYRFFGGYLETMYAGVGGEALYWPHKSRIGVGASLAYAKQRDFDRRLDLLDYGVVTGHVSAYWATPFYNYDAAVHVGRYLAKDWGATLEVRRTFKNGWQVGAWASLTDVPFDVFGEGSFDKGFFFQVPLNGLFGGSSRNKLSTRMRPIQRDGGQRLDGYSGDIFWDIRAARYDALQPDLRWVL